ncbi:MAG: ATP-dependent sacrificial sulfur transferase LarE [Defluviitaleaceae bacterium]|nr:ATP-dependent sacrificial sulfur transferase LarE [Defluviitaleaceae bacterium]
MGNAMLDNFFDKNPKLALCYSGGADSSYLLYAGVTRGADIKPYFVKTRFQPQFELEDAVSFCEWLKTELLIIELEILGVPQVASNGRDRCYHCKRMILGEVIKRSALEGYGAVADGTNASDDASSRPGMRALDELGVISPLRACGLAKNEIRALSRGAGLPTADKPAYSCLATRIQTDTEITSDHLRKIEETEGLLFRLGFSGFRVRYRADGLALIEAARGQMRALLEKRDEIQDGFAPYFASVALDLRGRDDENE